MIVSIWHMRKSNSHLFFLVFSGRMCYAFEMFKSHSRSTKYARTNWENATSDCPLFCLANVINGIQKRKFAFADVKSHSSDAFISGLHLEALKMHFQNALPHLLVLACRQDTYDLSRKWPTSCHTWVTRNVSRQCINCNSKFSFSFFSNFYD